MFCSSYQIHKIELKNALDRYKLSRFNFNINFYLVFYLKQLAAGFKYLVSRSLRQPWLLLSNVSTHLAVSIYQNWIEGYRWPPPDQACTLIAFQKISSPTLRIWTARHEQFLESAKKPAGIWASVSPFGFCGLVGFRISSANCRRRGIIAGFLNGRMLKIVSVPVFYKCIIWPPIHTVVERFEEISKKTSRPMASIVGIGTVVFNISPGFNTVLKVLPNTFLLGC